MSLLAALAPVLVLVAGPAEAGETTPELPLPPLAWSDGEISAARERCVRVLSGIAARTEPHPPIRNGRCGAPAPVRLLELGSSRPVKLSEALPLTCEMVATLARWIESALQPVAMTTLGEPIVGLAGISSYQCRNQIGDPATAGDLSEHALANAIDISTFVTARGRRITVAGAWGPVAGPSAPPPGGVEPGPLPAEAMFLRAIHRGACRHFTTVIGPNSNAAHRDHFHFDLTPADPGDWFCE